MPRFGAENIDTNLMEMMRQQLLEKMMFDETPLAQQNSFMDQDMAAIRRHNRQNQVPRPNTPQAPMVDPVSPGGVYNDTMTEGQRQRNRRGREEAYLYSKPEATVPLHHNNPPSSIDAEAMGTVRGPLAGAYGGMPMQVPRYPMMEMPPPDQAMPMEQLMQFYTNEDI